MSIANCICLLGFVVQQLMNSGQALNLKDSFINNISKDRIIEGKLADPDQFPWMAAIYRNRFDYKLMKPIPNNHSSYCGGTIINPHFILTAAHCVFEFDDRIGVYVYQYQNIDFRVVVGSSDIAGNSLKLQQVEMVLVHHSYNNMSSQNDIALIKLSQLLIFNDTIQPMKLTKMFVNDYQMATVAGWGDQCQPHQIKGHLRFASVKIIPFKNCAKSHLTEPVTEESALCVGPDLHVAKGDSGSGMWIKENENRYLIGIASIASPCYIEKPAVFTNVPYFYNWIIENILLDSNTDDSDKDCELK